MNDLEKDAEQYAKNLAYVADEDLNTLTFGAPDETVSSRVGKAAREGKWWGKVLQPIINFIMRNPKHCQESIIEDRGSKSVIPD